MREQYIFSVGKADFGAQSVARIHSMGYKAGIFVDSAQPTRVPSSYELSIPFDFSDPVTSLKKIPTTIDIQGLITTYEKYIPAKSLIGTRLGVPVPSVQSAKLCTDKTLMREAFLRYDASITPLYQQIESIDDALDFAASHGYPVIIKPASLVKSLLVMRCDNDKQLRENITSALREIDSLYERYGVIGQQPKLLIEQFVTGQMYTIAGFVDSHGELQSCEEVVTLTTAQQRHIDDNYLYRRTLPSAIDHTLKDSLFDVAKKGVAALEMRSSPAHIELIVNEDRSVKIIEIGARIGGYRTRMYEMCCGIDLLEAEIKTALDQPLDLHGLPAASVSVYELFPAKHGTFVGGIDEQVTKRFTYFSQKVNVGDLTGPAKDGFKATVVIIASSDDFKDYQAQCALAESIVIEVT